MALLEVQDLVIEFVTERGTLRAVDRISFSLDKGKTLGLVGESGCGKSVTALSILRLLASPPARIPAGQICFEGEDLLKLDPEAMRRRRGKDIAMIFQEPMTSLNPVLTAGFQIEEVLEVHFPEIAKEQRRERAIELLRKVGIPEPAARVESYPHELSGGMRQRVMIAMALACSPQLLIADEPTTALDVTIQSQILQLISSLQREMGMAVLLITHDLGVVAETVDQVVVMYAGRIAEIAPTREIFERPLHPYTRGLMDSLPSARLGPRGRTNQRLKGIPGSVPDISRLPKGCRFQERCALVRDECRQSEPALVNMGNDHWVSCFETGKVS